MNNQQLRQIISQRLLIRLRVFFVIFLATSVIIAVDVVRYQIHVGVVVAGILLGLVVGIVVSRKYRLSWDEQSMQVVAQVDWVGGIILAVYVLSILGREWIFGHWIQAASLTVFCLCVSAGSMIGQLVGAERGVAFAMQAIGMGNTEEVDHDP